MIRRHVVVHGRVQGVFFRDSMRREAERLAVGGWARNCSDGTVEAVFEGPQDAVEAMIAWCHHGPPRARVVSLDVHDESHEGLTTFDIR
jgi:acylphosphatase